MIDLFELGGKNAVVVGGGYGMGRRTALLLADLGANVAAVDRNAGRAEAVAAEVRARGVRGLAVCADVARPSACDEAIARAAQLGPLHVLVNIVGHSAFSSLLKMEEGVLEQQFAGNAAYVFYTGRAFARLARQDGHGGAIVNMASLAGLRGSPLLGAYGASKAALVSLTQTMAVEWGRYGIRVNALAPGETNTDRTHFSAETEAAVKGMVPLGRVGTQDEVAKAVVFLASNMSSMITGQVLVHDGGAMVTPLDTGVTRPG